MSNRMGMSAWCAVTLLVLGAVASPATATQSAIGASAVEQPPLPAARLFAVIYHQGPNWKVEQPMHRQALREHLEYYRRGMDEGHVFAAGGLIAINGGLAILTMADLREAKAFLAADPAILNGTLAGDVHAWTTPFLSQEPIRVKSP